MGVIKTRQVQNEQIIHIAPNDRVGIFAYIQLSQFRRGRPASFVDSFHRYRGPPPLAVIAAADFSQPFPGISDSGFGTDAGS